MKNLLIVTVALIGIAACNLMDKKAGQLSDEQRRNALKDSSNYTTIKWLDSTDRDLGTAKEGAKLEIKYRFKNIGTHNLIISDVKPSCGCTTPEWPQRPIPPGEEDVIKAVFDSQGKPGANRKEIHVLANTLPQNSTTLSFTVQINN
jgi:hypothetical protein